jgi:ATP-binding cassette, subfamily F, member 3
MFWEFVEVNKVTGNLDDYEKMMDIYEDTHEKTREKQEKKKQDMLAFADRFGAKASKAKQAQSKLKAVEKMETMVVLKKEPSIDFRFNYKQTPNRVLLTAKDMCFGYDLAKPLIKNVNFSIERKERIAIIGKNGSGKSTLMRLLLGDLPMQNGSLEINPNAEIAYFGQTNIDRLNPANTIVDELMKAFPSVDYGKIRAACGAMLFSGDDAKKSISVLSGGEKSRVLLAKILLTPANILLLDEPTHHLDMESVEALIKAIQVFDGAVVLVSHDESALRQFNADKLVICHSTRQETFLGNYDLFLDKKGWEEEIERENPAEEAKKIAQEKTKEQLQELRNLKKEISSIEKKIEFAEKNKKKLEETLASNPSADGTIFRQYEEMSLKLDGHYRDLQTLLTKEEALQ